jgi:H/ACA ribonucleoprotein complex subunit 4
MDIEKLKERKTIKELLEFGLINFDKPADCTSFDVVDFVRKKLKLRKASHFGTLDPMVTGVLPLALNRAVKLTGFFIGEDKEYTGVMRMHEDVSLEEIRKVIEKKFVGKIIQLPPVRSSVKRQEREREIKKFELLEKDGKDISFIVECQGGTYIRKLVHDLGEEMKIGAHMI